MPEAKLGEEDSDDSSDDDEDDEDMSEEDGQDGSSGEEDDEEDKDSDNGRIDVKGKSRKDYKKKKLFEKRIALGPAATNGIAKRHKLQSKVKDR